MNEWQPLPAEDALSTPSSLTSVASTPEPEQSRHMNGLTRDNSVKMNKFGTTERACPTPGCEWMVEPTQSSGLCVVCEQKKYSQAEREKLKQMLNGRTNGLMKPTCAICARAVVLPPVVRPVQFIICTICEAKMLSANAMSGSVKSSARLPASKPNQPAHTPSSRPHAVSHADGQPNARLLELQAPAVPKAGQNDQPLTIRLPKPQKATSHTKKPPVETTAQSTEAQTNAKSQSPTAEPSKASFARPTKRKATAKMYATEESKPSPGTTPPPPVARSFLSALLLRWEQTEQAIETLSKTPHFNDRGEYITPPSPLVSRDAVSSSCSGSSFSMPTPPSPEEIPLSLRRHVKSRAKPAPLLSPLTNRPLQHRPATSSSTFVPTSMDSNSSAAPEFSSASRHDRPRLTLRLPSRKSLNNVTDAGPSPVAPGSAGNPHTAGISPSATTTLRPCRRVGCTATLDSSHPWIFCADCLKSKEPKTLSPSEPLTWNPAVDIQGTGRRQTEPDVLLAQGVAEVAGDRHRRVSEPSILPAMGEREGKVHRLKDSGRSSLPTPPPSSRQGSPDAPVQASSSPSSPRITPATSRKKSCLPSPSSSSSSPELPVASSSSSPSPTAANAPRYTRKEDPDENLWDSDLSELTPLESSDESDSEARLGDTSRGRDASPQGSCLPGTKGFVCVRSKCHNLLVPWSKWKMCHTCRLRFRQQSRERQHRVFVPDSATATGVDGVRPCAIRTCKTLLPPEDRYRWKLCEECRTRTRRQSRKRRYGEVGFASDEDGEDAELLARLERRKDRVAFKKLRLTFKGTTVASVDAQKRARAKISVIVPDDAVRCPLYQTMSAMLDALRARLLGFEQATTAYLRFKLQQLAPPAAPAALDDVQPTFFAFDGEFSVIADPAGGEVGSRIQEVQADVGRALGIAFDLAGYEIQPDGTIVGQYSCMHELLVPLPLPPKTVSLGAVKPESADESQENFVFDVIAKRMQGELRILVLWDRSHKYFPGLRTIVQFKLVG